MTKEELKQIPWLRQEIKLLESKIENLPVIKDSVTGSRIGIPYDNHCIPIEGVDVKCGLKLKILLEIKKDELQEKLLEMEIWLNNIADSDIRILLRLRFQDDLSWDGVAANTGGKHTADSARKKVERFLNKLQ